MIVPTADHSILVIQIRLTFQTGIYFAPLPFDDTTAAARCRHDIGEREIREGLRSQSPQCGLAKRDKRYEIMRGCSDLIQSASMNWFVDRAGEV